MENATIFKKKMVFFKSDKNNQPVHGLASQGGVPNIIPGTGI